MELLLMAVSVRSVGGIKREKSPAGICTVCRRPGSLDNEKWLAVLDRLAILGQNAGDLAGFV